MVDIIFILSNLVVDMLCYLSNLVVGMLCYLSNLVMDMFSNLPSGALHLHKWDNRAPKGSRGQELQVW